MSRYAVVLELEDDGGYSVWVPDLPGCASQGDTRDEALANIREAIECHLEALRELGQPIPAPRTEFGVVEVSAA